MRIAETDILIVPGLGNSGPGHWQRRWGDRFSTARFVEQEDWDDPDPRRWIYAIEREIMLATRPVVLIAHSLAKGRGVNPFGDEALAVLAAEPEMTGILVKEDWT